MQLPNYDIFLDLTRAPDLDVVAHLRDLALTEGLFEHGRHVTIVLPMGRSCADEDLSRMAHFFKDGVTALRFALSRSAERHRALALVIGAWRWRNQTLGLLAAEADRDPMISVLQPRFGDAGACGVLRLPGDGGCDLPAAAITLLPDVYLAPESLAALQILTPRALAAAPQFTACSLDEAYAQLMRGLRRRGYRHLICNRIIAPWPCASEQYLFLGEGLDAADATSSANMLASMPERRLETILSTAFSREGHPRLLLDCRGMPPSVNGTAVCILGFLQGFRQLGERGFQVNVLTSREASAFHELDAAFPEFEIQHDSPQGHFMATILLNQPWSVSAIRDLHNVSGLILFNMLDTIAWDIIYAAVPGLGRAWTVLGQTADALFFNSAYSRDRYCFRFHPDPRIPLAVTHHSMAAAEIIGNPDGAPELGEPFILVMGNEYDHKDVGGALECLTTAFPYMRFIAMGLKASPANNVTAMESGHISAAQMARIFTDAALVVFPSHYEGFGLPVAEALAYGKTIVVRESPLWKEIGALSSHPELIVPFRVESDLITAVGEVLHGLRSVGRRPSPPRGVEPTWADCAGVMMDVTEAALTGFDGRRWLAREAMLASA